MNPYENGLMIPGPIDWATAFYHRTDSRYRLSQPVSGTHYQPSEPQ